MVKSDKCMGVSQLLGARAGAVPQSLRLLGPISMQVEIVNGMYLSRSRVNLSDNTKTWSFLATVISSLGYYGNRVVDSYSNFAAWSVAANLSNKQVIKYNYTDWMTEFADEGVVVRIIAGESTPFPNPMLHIPSYFRTCFRFQTL